MAQSSGFDPTFKVKTCFDAKMFDVHTRVVANPTNMLKGTDLHPKDHSIQSLQTPQTKAQALTQSKSPQGSVVRHKKGYT